ncbi:MAG: SCO family protein [Anaerolineales bacterium]|nr:SCO family protein [Anaerolineales bacterium]
MSKNLYLQLGFGLLLGAALVLAGTLFFKQPYAYQGSLIDPPALAADFELDAPDGTIFRLGDHHGQVVLLYFGYTFCPDVCPTTLYDLTRVNQALGDLSKDTVVAMVTVDPQRDTREVLGKYVTTFSPGFYGLTADFETLKSVWSVYGVYREEKPVEGSAGYLVDHTARVYVIDRQGNLRMTFPFGMSWEAMASDLEQLLKE